MDYKNTIINALKYTNFYHDHGRYGFDHISTKDDNVELLTIEAKTHYNYRSFMNLLDETYADHEFDSLKWGEEERFEKYKLLYKHLKKKLNRKEKIKKILSES